MKRTTIPLSLIACVLAFPAQAQVKGFTTLNFSMPSSVDPDALSIAVSGLPYTVDDTAIPILGSTFLPAVQNGLDGLNILGRVVGKQGDVPIVEVLVTTPFGDSLAATSSVGIAGQGFIPWSETTLNMPGEQAFDFRQQTGSATLNLGSFAGLFTATSNDPLFNSAAFTITGFTSFQNFAPEPGALATLGSLLMAGGMALLRRSRRARTA